VFLADLERGSELEVAGYGSGPDEVESVNSIVVMDDTVLVHGGQKLLVMDAEFQLREAVRLNGFYSAMTAGPSNVVATVGDPSILMAAAPDHMMIHCFPSTQRFWEAEPVRIHPAFSQKVEIPRAPFEESLVALGAIGVAAPSGTVATHRQLYFLYNYGNDGDFVGGVHISDRSIREVDFKGQPLIGSMKVTESMCVDEDGTIIVGRAGGLPDDQYRLDFFTEHLLYLGSATIRNYPAYVSCHEGNLAVADPLTHGTIVIYDYTGMKHSEPEPSANVQVEQSDVEESTVPQRQEPAANSAVPAVPAGADRPWIERYFEWLGSRRPEREVIRDGVVVAVAPAQSGGTEVFIWDEDSQSQSIERVPCPASACWPMVVNDEPVLIYESEGTLHVAAWSDNAAAVPVERRFPTLLGDRSLAAVGESRAGGQSALLLILRESDQFSATRIRALGSEWADSRPSDARWTWSSPSGQALLAVGENQDGILLVGSMEALLVDRLTSVPTVIDLPAPNTLFRPVVGVGPDSLYLIATASSPGSRVYPILGRVDSDGVLWRPLKSNDDDSARLLLRSFATSMWIEDTVATVFDSSHWRWELNL